MEYASSPEAQPALQARSAGAVVAQSGGITVRADASLGDDVYLRLGNLRFRRQEQAEAERCWTRALELDPTNAIVRSNLAAVRRTVA